MVHNYQEYVCKHLAYLFPKRVSYNRFVELEKEVLLLLAVFIKEVLLGTCTCISFVDSNPLRVCRNQRIRMYKTFEGLASRGNVPWDGFSGSSCTWSSTTKVKSSISCLRQGMWTTANL